jgi:isocitrate/isopropylmalate dehydrogenase
MKEYNIASIPGKGIANPVGQIWSGAMMLDI